MHKSKFTLYTLLITLASLLPVQAHQHTYQFEILEDQLPVATRVEFNVRIINTETGEPVTDAMVVADRIDLTPDGRPDRTTHLAALTSDTPGIYRYRANLVEAGDWQLTLMTMIPGAEGLVEGKMIVRARSDSDNPLARD